MDHTHPDFQQNLLGPLLNILSHLSSWKINRKHMLYKAQKFLLRITLVNVDICRKMCVCSHLLNTSLTENFIFAKRYWQLSRGHLETNSWNRFWAKTSVPELVSLFQKLEFVNLYLKPLARYKLLLWLYEVSRKLPIESRDLKFPS